MTLATPEPEPAPIIKAFKLLTEDPEFQALHQAVKNDQSADKFAEVDLWMAVLHHVFSTSNYKINMLDLKGPGLPIPYQVIEVLDTTPHHKAGDESEEILMAIHVWKKFRKGSIFNEVAWRQGELANYWKSRGWRVKEPDSVSVDEKRWIFRSGVRVLDRKTEKQSLDVFWTLTMVFDIRGNGVPVLDGIFTLEKQLEELDRFLAMIKRKKRAHEFENVDWEYADIPTEQRAEVKRRVAAIKAKLGEA